MQEALQSLIPLISAKALINDVNEFHSKVNIIFHNYEANDYDTLHNEMWQSLPFQYELLINDIDDKLKTDDIKVLDVGCGTGLATQLLLNGVLSDKISTIHLLDTSDKMLKKAEDRAKKWNKNIRFINGDISHIDDDYNFIIISSVLHHIPDLSEFFNNLIKHQKTGDFLMTIHDPLTEAIQSDIYKSRCDEYNQYKNKNPNPKAPLLTRVLRKLNRTLTSRNYISKINNALLEQKIIKVPLTGPELWSITDIHVEGLPYSANEGVSKAFLTKMLSKYDLVSFRTYSFFGTLISNLHLEYQIKEKELNMLCDQHGRNFGSVWIKKQD